MKTVTNSIIAALAVLFVLSCEENTGANYTTAKKPLVQNSYIELPLGNIEADGWLHEMLVRQANGATGHLDELYPAVMGPRNGWLGGDGDQWERGPYWIDGLLPLGYILHDENLIAKATPWIEWTLQSQQSNGQFGPMKDYSYEPGLQRDCCQDWWPRMVVLKILQQHYSATGDERVISFMTNYFRYQLEMLDKYPLDHWRFWGRYRGGDNLMCVYWLYNITGDDFLLELGDKIYRLTEPFTDQFLERKRLSRIGTIHCVNLAQGMKTPIVYSQYDDDPKYELSLEYALDDIRQFHGVPTGVFNGDEAIHGTSPTQGTELCTIVEYMFSLETMYRINGNPRYADLLEKVAYNALPAQTDDEYMTRQYFQQANQISSLRIPNNFDCDHGLDNCFGLLTGYPCCTSNMHQGWPKFVQNTWYATPEGGLAAIQYAPTRVKALVAGGIGVEMTEETKYPFETGIKLAVSHIDSPAKFPLEVRIPGWARSHSISINGEKLEAPDVEKGIAVIERVWSEGDEVLLDFEAATKLTIWHENSRAVERGPLVYALKIPSEKNLVENHIDAQWQGSHYYEIRPKGPWNYALIECPANKMDTRYIVDASKAEEDIIFPWNEENAPVTIRTKAVRALKWHEYNGQAGPMPYSIEYSDSKIFTDEEETVELIPYGCTTLRITEFPMKGNHNADNYNNLIKLQPN